MKNQEVAKVLSEMAQLMELAEENRFKVRAYANAAQTLFDLTEDVEAITRKGKLTDLPGIGQGIADKISEYCLQSKITEYEELKLKFPKGLLEMMQVSGLGPKRTKILFEKMKIDTVAKLQQAAKNGKLKTLEGFGSKIEENILKGIAFKDEASKRILLSEGLQWVDSIAKELKDKCRSIEKLVPAGSLRRWKETVGDLDFLCVSQNPKEVIQHFINLKWNKQVLAQGETKASVILANGIQCDLRVVPAESFGAALLYFTGSKEHNVALREWCLKKGYTINEYGLYALSNKKKAVAGRTEEEVYKKLGLEFIPPELRENRGELDAAIEKKLPKLVEEKDVRGDFHNHTKLSDGANSLEEMAARARAKGWEWFASADHSQSLKVAHGLSRETLLRKKNEIEKLNKQMAPFKMFLSSEVDILSDGNLDYDGPTLKELDFVVASVHTGFSQGEEKITQRICSAMKNPYVDIIAHLTGRLLNSRDGYPVNYREIFSEAALTQTALEINGQPQRLDLYDRHAKTAGEMGVKMVLSTDAHSVTQLDFMTFAVATARRAWLTKEHFLNCMDFEQLMEWKRN